jgi:hypothetical protein
MSIKDSELEAKDMEANPEKYVTDEDINHLFGKDKENKVEVT